MILFVSRRRTDPHGNPCPISRKKKLLRVVGVGLAAILSRSMVDLRKTGNFSKSPIFFDENKANHQSVAPVFEYKRAQFFFRKSCAARTLEAR
jgi:hypothetical protein